MIPVGRTDIQFPYEIIIAMYFMDVIVEQIFNISSTK